MDISHLHLHVKDRRRACDFYGGWFGFGTRRDGDDITFLAGAGGFLLALQQEVAPSPLPDWFHFGIRMPSPAALAVA